MKPLTLAKLNKGSDLVVADQTFGGAIANWKPVGAPRFVATALGLDFDKGTMKDVRELAAAAGKTADDIKLARRTYDANLANFYQTSTNIAALTVANPEMRHVVRPKFGTKGNFMGVDHKARIVKVKPVTGNAALLARIAELEAQVAQKAA